MGEDKEMDNLIDMFIRGSQELCKMKNKSKNEKEFDKKLDKMIKDNMSFELK